MRPDGVVLFEPVIDHHPGLGHRAEQPAVQIGSAKDGIKTFVVRVLPRTARVDVMGSFGGSDEDTFAELGLFLVRLCLQVLEFDRNIESPLDRRAFAQRIQPTA